MTAAAILTVSPALRQAVSDLLSAQWAEPRVAAFMFARQLVSAGFEVNPSGRLFTLVAAVLAGIVGYKETRSPGRTNNIEFATRGQRHA